MLGEARKKVLIDVFPGIMPHRLDDIAACVKRGVDVTARWLNIDKSQWHKIHRVTAKNVMHLVGPIPGNQAVLIKRVD